MQVRIDVAAADIVAIEALVGVLEAVAPVDKGACKSSAFNQGLRVF